MAVPQYKNRHEIYTFCRPFLDYHNYILTLCEPCPEYRRIFFKKYISFTRFPPNFNLTVGVMKFTIFCHLILKMLHSTVALD